MFNQVDENENEHTKLSKSVHKEVNHGENISNEMFAIILIYTIVFSIKLPMLSKFYDNIGCISCVNKQADDIITRRILPTGHWYNIFEITTTTKTEESCHV